MIGFPLEISLLILSSLLWLSQAQNLSLGQVQFIPYTATTVINGRYSNAGAYLSSTNEYLVFGGFRSAAFSDFHSINLTSLESTQLTASVPFGRRFAMAYTSDLVSNFYVHGGRTGGSGMLITFKLSSFLITTDLNSVLE
jgi:hypothetical protein